MHTALLCYCQPGLAMGLFYRRQSFSHIQFVLLSSSCKKWSIAKRRLITVTGMNIIRDTILTDLRQRTDASTSICFVKWIWKIAAVLWGWIYTSWLSWFKRSAAAKGGYPALRCVTLTPSLEEATALAAPWANPAQLTNITGSPPHFWKSRLWWFRRLNALAWGLIVGTVLCSSGKLFQQLES